MGGASVLAMAKAPGMKVCPQGHEVHYPRVLDERASATGQEVAFCTQCECGTMHLVVVWPSDATVMASGGMELAERFEATGWTEQIHVDENGPFRWREPGPLEVAMFLKE